MSSQSLIALLQEAWHDANFDEKLPYLVGRKHGLHDAIKIVERFMGDDVNESSGASRPEYVTSPATCNKPISDKQNANDLLQRGEIPVNDDDLESRIAAHLYPVLLHFGTGGEQEPNTAEIAVNLTFTSIARREAQRLIRYVLPPYPPNATEPVSVSLDKCWSAAAKAIAQHHDSKHVAKAVLDAAGVAYVD